jgi:hypothetical protein
MAKAPNAQQQLANHAANIAKVLDDWSESSWGRDPPDIGTCREKIETCSKKIGEILLRLAAAQGARETAWLELFQANDDPQRKLREATDAGKYDPDLDGELETQLESIEKAEDKLDRAEIRVKWWRHELARIEADKRRYEFWREYHLVKDEAERFAFGCGSNPPAADIRPRNCRSWRNASPASTEDCPRGSSRFRA